MAGLISPFFIVGINKDSDSLPLCPSDSLKLQAHHLLELHRLPAADFYLFAAFDLK